MSECRMCGYPALRKGGHASFCGDPAIFAFRRTDAEGTRATCPVCSAWFTRRQAGQRLCSHRCAGMSARKP